MGWRKGSGRATWQWASAVAAIAAIAAVSWLALRPRSGRDRLQGAVDDVLAGEMACVEAAIGAAQGIADPVARERALLGFVDPDAALRASADQARRVLQALAGSPERVRLQSIEAAGPLSLADIRRVMASQIARFRACHARLGGTKETHRSPFTLRYTVAPDGRPQLPVRSESARIDPPDELAACAARAAAFLTLDAHPEPSAVTLVLRTVD
jgi:hypothetical protein